MTKKSWDDIDIAGLSMDSPDSREGVNGRRQERFSSKDLAAIILEQDKTLEIKIQNLTSQKESAGIILDISVGGVKFQTPDECREQDILRVSFTVGKCRILCRAKVCWIKKEEQGYLVGVQFIAPNETDVTFIKSLPTAVHLK